MSAARPVKIGVGMRDKRARILRSLDAHVRYLELVETMTPWAPPARTERPPRPPDPDPYRARPASHFYTPRERPELKYPAPGPEALSEEAVKAWVAIDPFVRGGLSYRTQAALAYIASFAPATVGALVLLGAVLLGPGPAAAGQLILSWTDQSADEQGFKVERCPVVAPATAGAAYLQIAVVPALADVGGIKTYVNTNLAIGATFCYRVRAYNQAGQSEYSNVACGTVSALLAPLPPADLQVQ